MTELTQVPWRFAYDQDETAFLLKVGKYTVRGLIRSGELRTIRVGRHDRIPHSAIEDYIKARLEEPAAS